VMSQIGSLTETYKKNYLTLNLIVQSKTQANFFIDLTLQFTLIEYLFSTFVSH